MRWIILFFLWWLGLPLNAQEDSLRSYHDSIPIVGYSPFYHEYTSYGIYGEVQFIRSPVIGLSASIARLTGGEWVASSKGLNLGIEFDPIQRFYGPKFTAWTDILALVFGVNGSLSTMYYFQGNQSGWYMRPEVGIGIPCLHLKYGFGFRLAGDEITGVQRHSLTLGYHFSIKEKERNWMKK